MPPINRLFIARPPLDYVPPVKSKADLVTMDKPNLHGIANDILKARQYCEAFSSSTTDKKFNEQNKKAKEKTLQNESIFTKYEGKSDPFNTIIVTRLPFSISERQLKREFERFGAIRSLSMINTPSGKFRGYAFIEYERERDARVAYKEADQMVMEVEDGKSRRVLVDVERGRTVVGWKPRRVGGGLGNTRRGPRNVCSNHRDISVNTNLVRRPSHDATASSSNAPVSSEPKRARIQYDDIY